MTNQDRNSFELIVALVGGVGTNFETVFHELKSSFELAGCHVEKIKITDFLKREKKENFLFDLKEKIYRMNIARKSTPSIASYLSMMIIFQKRIALLKNNKPIIYIIDSLKSPFEYYALRDVYRRNFVLLSIYETKDIRKKNLLSFQLNSINSHENLSKSEEHTIDQIMNDDENEGGDHGRDTKGTYQKAHYFMHMDSLKSETQRLVGLIFNKPFETPTRDESGMLHAYFSSLRSSDSSRQVGAVITDDDGNILSSGCNEVPKFEGGLHWHDTQPDLREYNTIDNNRVSLSVRIKKDKINNENLSGFEDSLEFFRAVHSEEAAICDAARRGISTQNSIMYCTTFPCHLCIKHIIASGIKEVVYIEPYVKSMAKELFEGLIKDKAPFDDLKLVKLRPFVGVSPKSYRYIFSKSKTDRRDPKNRGRIINWDLKTSPSIYLSHSTPIPYFWSEFYIINNFIKQLESYFDVCEVKQMDIDLKKINSVFSDVVDKYKNLLFKQ